MKKIFYILIVLLSACRFDPGVSPTNQKKNADVVDSSNKKDMSRDTKITRDQSSDTQKDSDLSTQSDASSDVSSDVKKDLQADIGPPDVGAMCNNVPIDLKTDPTNCGVCDNLCDVNFANCEEGSCKCPENAEPCGADNKCQDTKNDPLNCGGCGVSCGVAAECVNSACVCRNGYRDCNGKCVELSSDPLNCGECDKVCNGDSDSCNNGSCQRSCFGGGWSCSQNGRTYCATRSDIYTCNARATDNCGTECAVGEICRRTGTVTRECKTRRPTIDCQACPCAECGQNEDCVVSDLAGNEVFCVGK